MATGYLNGTRNGNGHHPPVRHRLLLVDDHPIVRQGLLRLVNLEDDLEISGEANCAQEALDLLVAQPFDLALVDVTLEGISGIELIRMMRERHPALPVLVLSMHHERFYAERALRAGAQGYIMKQKAPSEIITAIRRVLAGDLYLSQELSHDLLRRAFDTRTDHPMNPTEVLSDRELEVLQLIGQGIRTRDIADQLNLSIKTIESYRANIKRKLQLDNASELVHYAFTWRSATIDASHDAGFA